MLKFRNILTNGVTSYFKHFHVVIGYAIGLFITLLLNNYAFSIINNNVTFVYTKGYGFGIYLLILLAIIVSSLVYALFTSILVFVVRRDLFQGVKKMEMSKHIIQSGVKIFTLILSLNILFFILYFLVSKTVVAFIMPLVYLIASIFIFYTPQSIIIDEEGLRFGLRHNYNFIKKHKLTTFLIYIVFIILIFIVGLIGTYIGGTAGAVVGLIINTIILVPALEITKTIIYLTKFDIFDSYLKR